MNPAQAVAFGTLPILLAGSIYLNLGELLLQTALYRLAFYQGEAEIVEARSVDNPLDDCDLPMLRNVIGTDNLNPDLHPQLRHQRVPFPEKASLT